MTEKPRMYSGLKEEEIGGGSSFTFYCPKLYKYLRMRKHWSSEKESLKDCEDIYWIGLSFFDLYVKKSDVAIEIQELMEECYKRKHVKVKGDDFTRPIITNNEYFRILAGVTERIGFDTIEGMLEMVIKEEKKKWRAEGKQELQRELRSLLIGEYDWLSETVD